MAREWKPGEVALVTSMYGRPVTAVRCGPGENLGWAYADTLSGRPTQHWSSDRLGRSVIRPLVVIDPGDREQVDRLVEILVNLSEGAFPVRLQTALREFADPTPPRIDEPGLWGIVEAACVHSDDRRTWMRHSDDNWYVVGTDTKNNPDGWDSLIDPVLVREGVPS